MKKWIHTLLITITSATLVEATEGINLIGIGPVQQGTAGAGVASAKDSTWLILNPAGLTQIERNVDASLQYFAPRRTMNSTLNGGAGEQSDHSAFFIPTISASLGCCDNTNQFFGIGVYGTSGMGVDYNQPRIAGSGGDSMTELAVAKMTISYAQKFDNGLSLGAGPVFVFSHLRTDMFNGIAPQSGEWDEAVGIGFIVGANQKINDKLSIGASYISEQYMTEFDEYEDLLDGSLNLPQQLTVGLAYNVRTNLEVVVDYRWLGWSQLDTLGDQFGWNDQHIVKAGVTWGATDRLTLRSGISHGNSPIDADSAFGNTLFPAIIETHLACGLSYEFDRFTLHAAFTHALEETVTANGNDAGPMASFANGTEISMSQNSFTIGASFAF